MKKFKKIIFLVLLLSVILMPVLSLAQNNGTNPPGQGNGTNPPAQTENSGKIVNPINAQTLNELIKTILEGVLKIGIPIIVLAIIYCGFLFVSARGNPESIKKAKDALIYTLIGTAILLGSWAIAQLISSTVQAL
jgi:hypothetical protein